MDEEKQRAKKLFQQADGLFGQVDEVLLGETIGERIAERLAERRARRRRKPTEEERLIPEVKIPQIHQFNLDRRNFPVSQMFKVIATDFAGKLLELSLRSDVNTFSIQYRRDSEQRSYTYTDLTGIAPASKIMSAHQESSTDLYMVGISNLRWNQRFSFYISPDAGTTITFTNVWAVWEELR